MTTGTQQSRTLPVTVRKRKVKDQQVIYVPFYVSNISTNVEQCRVDLSDYTDQTFTTFEPNMITLRDGKQRFRVHVLWMAQDRVEGYHNWLQQQQRLREQEPFQQQFERTQAARKKQGELQFQNLTIEETAPKRLSDKQPQPLPHKPKQKNKEPPSWLLSMPAVIRDGNGNEYYWNALPATPPEPTVVQTIEPAPTLPKPDLGSHSQKTGHKGICRVDYPAKHFHGYRVCVTWNKRTKSKIFNDHTYGDRLCALDAAIQWRNQVEIELGKPRTEHQIIGVPLSNTGYHNISERQFVDNRGSERHVFEVRWRDYDGKMHQSCFSIKKHGRTVALRMAKKLRLIKWREFYRSNQGRTI